MKSFLICLVLIGSGFGAHIFMGASSAEPEEATHIISGARFTRTDARAGGVPQVGRSNRSSNTLVFTPVKKWSKSSVRRVTRRAVRKSN